MAIGTDREFLSAEEIERIALTMPYSDYVPGECHCVNVHLEDDYAIIELTMKSSGGTFRVKQQHTFHYVNCPRLTAGNGDAELSKRGFVGTVDADRMTIKFNGAEVNWFDICDCGDDCNADCDCEAAEDCYGDCGCTEHSDDECDWCSFAGSTVEMAEHALLTARRNRFGLNSVVARFVDMALDRAAEYVAYSYSGLARGHDLRSMSNWFDLAQTAAEIVSTAINVEYDSETQRRDDLFQCLIAEDKIRDWQGLEPVEYDCDLNPNGTGDQFDAASNLTRYLTIPAISGGASTETVVAAYLDGDQSAAAELRRRSIEAKRSQAVVERDTGESKSARIAKRSARRSRNRSSRRGSKQRLRYLSDAQID